MIDDKKFDTLLQQSGITPTKPAGGDWYSQIKKAPKPEDNTIRSSSGAPIVGGMVGGILKSVGDITANRGEAVRGNILGTSPESQGEDALTRGVQATGNAFAAITDTGGEIAKALYHHIVPKSIQENIKNYKPEETSEIPKAVNSVLSKANEELGIRLDEFIKKYPDVGKAVETTLKKSQGLGNIAGGILTADQIAKTAQKAVDVTKNVIDKAQNIPQSIQKRAESYAEKSLRADWEKPAKTNQAGYKKASEIYRNAADNGHDISDTLMKNKISVSDNIQDHRYATLDTADNIRADAGQMSKDLLRPSLEQADFSTPRTSVKEVMQNAIDNINNDRFLTQEAKDALMTRLETTQGALERQFPDGLSLVDMHDEKIIRDLSSKYSPIGDIATNAEAAKNKAIADSLRSLVEDKAPEGLPVHEFNAELAKQYQAADYLESLNTKKAPMSIASRIAKTASKVAGASVGSGIGGGVLGGVGGYHIGGMVESMIEDMPNPIKINFLKNLQVSNPEAFQAVSDYLGAEEMAGLQRLGLPAPAPLGTEKNPIVTPAPSEETQMAGRADQLKNLRQSDSVAQPINNANSNVIDKTISDVKEYVKNPKLGNSIEDVSKLKTATDVPIRRITQVRTSTGDIPLSDMQDTSKLIKNSLLDEQARGINLGPNAHHGAALGRQITEPITLAENGDGTYTLLDGNHRLVQAMINDSKTIPAITQAPQSVLDTALKNNIKMYDSYIKSGAVHPDEVYQNVAKKIYNPEISKHIIEDVQSSLDRGGFKDLSATFGSIMKNIPVVTPKVVTDTLQKLIDIIEDTKIKI